MYVEVVVPRKTPPLLNMLRILLGALVITGLLLGFMVPFSLLAAGVFAFLFWLVGRNIGMEYQYCLLEDEIDVDVINGYSKRKRVTTLKAGQAVLLAPLGSPELGRFRNLPVVDYSAKNPETETYVMVYRMNGGEKQILLMMTEPFKAALKKLLGSKMVDAE